MIKDLTTRMAAPLPGVEAQFRMAHVSRMAPIAPPPHAKQAAVLLLLLEAGGQWRVIMIERALHDQDKHSGQISFPGGSFQADDKNLSTTALREAEEEIGMPRNRVQLLGALTELYIPVSNFLVQPFVGVLTSAVSLVPQPGEVQTILQPELDFFLDDSSKKAREITVGTGIRLKDVPAYVYNDKVIWGATAMIMSEFCELVKTL